MVTDAWGGAEGWIGGRDGETGGVAGTTGGAGGATGTCDPDGTGTESPAGDEDPGD